jgi:MFS transporter, SP family, sugar:H+ symporter
MILHAVGVVASIISLFLMRYFGRRPIFISGTSVAAFCMFAVAIISTAAPGNRSALRAAVAFVMFYEASYSFSIGPCSWTVASEIPSNRLRSQTMGVAMGINFLAGRLVTFTLPYFFNPQHLGWVPKIGFLWGPVNLCFPINQTNSRILTLWLVLFLPETKGRTLEEMDELFGNKVRAWNFKSYQLVGLNNTIEVQQKLHEKVQVENRECG